jgi:uncharacterized protein (DUF302 family)
MEDTIQASVAGEFDDVVDATNAALNDEGFGVGWDIDIQATLKECESEHATNVSD